MSEKEKRIFEYPGWEKNKLKSNTYAIAEIWENVWLRMRAIIRRDEAGEVIWCFISGM